MTMTLLKRLNIVLYGVAAFLFILLFLPTEQWFHVQNLNFKLTFFILPFFGLATLPTAIYTKNVRQILVSTMLTVCYFMIFGLITLLSGLLGSDLYRLLIR